MMVKDVFDSAPSGRQEDLGWRGVFVVSALLHLLIFSLVLFAPGPVSTRTIKGEIYEVNLVELPAAPPGRAVGTVSAPPAQEVKSKPSTEKAAPAKRIPPPASPPEVEKPVVIAKRTLKKEQPKEEKPKESPSQLISQALEKIEKKVQVEEKNPLEKVLAQMEQKVVAAERQEHLQQALANIETQAKGSGGGAFGPGSPEGTIGNRIYEMAIRERIKSNWSFPALSSEKENPEAVVILRVQNTGKILDSRFEKRSSNALFDQSVMKAIERSDPLPAFPPGFRMTSEEMVISFNLQELEGH
jgi:colicin import membrane protein